MKKSILIIRAFLLVALVAQQNILSARADYGSTQCQPIYGGGENCVKTPQFEINKTVQNPQTQSYVDNLGVNDPKYKAGQTVPFKITVKNTTNEKITKLTIKDTLPNYIEFVSGEGSYDANTKILSFTVDSLNPGEVKAFTVQGKIVTNDRLPVDQGVICVVNQAHVSVGGKMSQDNSQFCIEKTPANPEITKGGLKVFPPSQAKTTPDTGPEAFAIFGLIPAGLSGFILRKKSLLSHGKGGDK